MNRLMISAVIILIIIFAVFLIGMKNNPGAMNEKPMNYKTYTDPANHYNISVPEGWVSSSGFGRLRTGMNTNHEESTRTEVTYLKSGNIGLNISVYEKTPECSKIEKPNTTLAGMPAVYDGEHYSWTVNTDKSTIVVGYYYPGAGVYHKRIKDNNPVSQTEIDANQKTITDIVSTLKFNSVSPLICQ